MYLSERLISMIEKLLFYISYKANVKLHACKWGDPNYNIIIFKYP